MASNGRSCATKHARSFAFSLAMVVCKPCGCNVPASLLAEHNRGWKHLQNVIANDSESTDPSTLQKPPSSFQDSQPVSLQTTSPAISAPTSTSDSRVAISHEGGLDFVVEGTEVARRISFPPVDLAILIKKTEVVPVSPFLPSNSSSHQEPRSHGAVYICRLNLRILMYFLIVSRCLYPRG